MSSKKVSARYRQWYAWLLCFYPAPWRKCFSETMEQTFGDLLAERAQRGRSTFSSALWMFTETIASIFYEQMHYATMKNKRLIGILLTVVALLLIPLIAMQFTDEVAWTASDFIFAAALLGGTGIALELALRSTGDTAYRIAFAMGLAGAFLLVWINGAVGIIGDEGNPANLLYGGVLAIGFFGSILSLFQPKGMARALFAAAIAQALVPVVALIIWSPQASFVNEVPGIVGVLVLNAFFVSLFAGSGLLFQRSTLTGVKA